MQKKPNKVRAKLAQGGYVTGSVIYTWSPNVMEAAGLGGLDFMRIDNEHAWRQDNSAEHLMRAAVIADVVPIMRVDRDNPYLIRKALEIGAGGIIVPDVNTPEGAEAVVKASKFPPRGIRGYSGNCWSGGWGSKAGAEWVQWSDTEPMIGVMIENVKAMDCIDEIVAVDGIDFVLFGPADYSMSLGLRKPAKNDERVQAALKKTITATRKAGKHVMFNPGIDTDEIQKYVEMGITMLELSNDLGILRSVWAKTSKALEDMTSSYKM